MQYKDCVFLSQFDNLRGVTIKQIFPLEY